MTDMRNFNQTPSNDLHAHTVLVDSDDVIIKDNYTLDESGEGLGEFHTNSDLIESGNGRGKVVGALVIALMLGTAGAYVYSTMPAQNQDVVANADLPRPAGPGAGPGLAAMMPNTPAPALEAAPTSDPAAEAMTPSATAVTTPEPVAPAMAPAPVQRQAAAPRVTAPVTTPAPAPEVVAPVEPVAPQVTQQASSVPEPVSPTPPASAVAGNPPLNEQSVVPDAVAPVTPAVPVDAAPVTPEPAAPAEALPAQ
jgi:hypothetical protein